MTVHDLHAPHDSSSHILPGAQARSLGPEDSPRAVLFIHGYAGCGNNFADLPDRLAGQGWRVRVMLLPGHGTSPRDLEHVANEELIAAVKTELAELRANRDTAVLVGHSMGGALATLVASEEPVDGLVLGAPYYAVTHRWYYGFKAETWEKLVARLVRWVYKGKLFLQLNRRENADKIVCYAFLPTKSLLRAHELAQEASSAETLRRVRCPVLMLHSHHDVASSPTAAVKAFRVLGSSDKRLVWVDRSNHHIFWDYDQEKVQQEVLDFTAHIANQRERT